MTRSQSASALQRLLNRMQFLHEVSQKISEMMPLPKLLDEIMENSKAVMHAEASSLLLYEPEEKRLNFLVATGEKGKLVKKYSVELGDGIAGWVAKHRKPALVADCYRDARFNPEYDKKSRFKTKSMICVPLVRKNQLLGVMQVINKMDDGAFDEHDLTIFETLAAQCAIAIENSRLLQAQVERQALERELQTARAIQQKLLPAALPDFRDLEVAARLIPAKQVGGDYYDVLRMDDRRSLFFVADVTGKGIPAALIVSTIYACLRSYLKFERAFDLLALVYGLNRVLIESTTFDKFASCWFGLYDHDSRTLTSINAGHNPPYLFRAHNSQPIELKRGGVFLGVIDQPYETERVELQASDVLTFFTDGVTEAWNEQEEEYSEARLIALVTKLVHKSAAEILRAIEEDVRQHVGKAPQSDDFTCVVAKVLA